MTAVAGFAGRFPGDAPPGRADFCRVWAAADFTRDLETARGMMFKLARTEGANRCFPIEQSDFYGDPALGLKQPARLAWWRQRLLDKAFFSGALAVSEDVSSHSFGCQALLTASYR